MIYQTICAFFSSMAFAIIFNIRGKKILYASLGGGIGWFFYLLTLKYSGSTAFSLFLGSVTIAIYGEIMARILKATVTTFIISSLIPMVPGNGMFYTMYESIKGNMDKSISIGYETLLNAGSIAIGVVLVSTIVRVYYINKLEINSKKMPKKNAS